MLWGPEEFAETKSVLELESVDCCLALTEIYGNVTFDSLRGLKARLRPRLSAALYEVKFQCLRLHQPSRDKACYFYNFQDIWSRSSLFCNRLCNTNRLNLPVQG